jgi:outer membrane protein assembly factor BamB
VTGESAGAGQYDIDYATVAYRARNGRQAWVARHDRGGADRAGALAVDADHVFVTGDSFSGPGGSDYDALTVALDRRDGKVAWQTSLGGAGFDSGRALAAGGGRVIVATQSPGMSGDGGLDALTAAYEAATGRELWRVRLAEPRRSELANDLALAPAADIAYLVASSRPAVPYTALDEQQVLALRVADGSTEWSTRLDAGAGNALRGDTVAVAPDGLSVVTLGQRTRSADPLGPPWQDVYDSLVVALDP